MRRLILDEQFPIGSSYRFDNQYQELANGDLQIIVGWSQPLAEYDVSRAFFSPEKLGYLAEFFSEVAAQTFLYLDPADNFCNDYKYQPKPDILTWGQLLPIEDNLYQLCKCYQAGESISIRPITRPSIDENFRIASATDSTVNPKTGLVLFDSPPTEAEIFWQGQFFVPCQLLEQDYTTKIESNNIDYSLPEFRFAEIRESEVNSQTNELPQSVSAELDLDLIVGSTITTVKKIARATAGNGWQRSLELWEQPTINYSSAQKILAYREDTEAAIALYRATYGGTIAFKYRGKNVRIADSSPLSITTEASFTWNIDRLNLREVGAGSLLDSIDAQTYIVPIIDSSGSMNNDIPNVEEAIALLRPLVKDKIYRSQFLTDKYFKPIQYLGDERWLDWLARDYRDDPSEADKVIILAWINESEPVYHSASSFSPTAAYDTDMSSFLASHPNRDSFSAVIYAVEFTSAAFTFFQNHLIAAHAGTDGYNPPLTEYGVTIRPDLVANTPASFYLEDLQGANSLSSRAANFIARCWSLEQRIDPPNTVNISAPNYASTLIVPDLQQPKTNYKSFVFGRFRSSIENSPLDCGDWVYWRSRYAIAGISFTVREDDDDYYEARATAVNPGSNGRTRSSIVWLTEAQFNQRTQSEIGNSRTVRRSTICRRDDGAVEPTRGYDAEVIDSRIIDSDVSAVPEPISAYFTYGQCEGVEYGFRVKYGNDLIAGGLGSITGPVTEVGVYFAKQSGEWTYHLSATNAVGETANIAMQSGGEYLTPDLVSKGIYDVQAIRTDDLEDTCGNLDGSSNEPLEQTTAPDAKIVGFTNHDRPIEFDGLIYTPTGGGNAQAREHSEDLESSNNTETTFLFCPQLDRQDLLDGLWSGAKFVEWLVPWDRPAERKKLATGYIGRTITEVAKDGIGLSFKLEMRSLLARLQNKNYFLTIKSCGKTYGKQGDGNCRVNLFGNIDSLEIVEVIDSVTFRVNSNRTIENFYGQITMLSGFRSGVSKLVDSFDSTTNTIVLRSSLSNLSVGDTLNAIAKCDKSLKACMDFKNTVNFGGFWHVPGVDMGRRTDR